MNLMECFVGTVWASPFAGVWAVMRADLLVGLPSVAEDQVTRKNIPSVDVQLRLAAVRSLDDYAGYHTSNGLGSLDIGGGRSRWGE
jgi:hypothetical protein